MSSRSFTRTHSSARSSTAGLTPQNHLPTRSFGVQAKPAEQNESQPFGHDLTVLPFGIQAKLTIGEPGDKYEQEADQVAAQVVQQINAPPTQQTGAVQRESANLEEEQKVQAKPMISQLQREAMPEEDEELQTKSLVQREEMPEEEELQMKSLVQREEMPEEEELQMKSLVQRRSLNPNSSTSASPDLETSINTARGNGQPLSDEVRGSMEQSFGRDFSGVRVHTDTQSDQLNQSVQARAFTTGQDIFFRQGEYQPGNRNGQELLAHELTHVVQQNQTLGISRKELLINRKEEIQETPGGLNQEGKKPVDVDDGQAERIGQEVLQTFGYEEIMAMATDAGLIEKKGRSEQESLQAKFLNAETGLFRQTVAAPMAPTFFGVFSRYAAAAGVTSQVDSPAPGPADAVAIGILAIGLIHAGYVLMASPGNQADTGIVNEAQDLIRAGQAATICAALALLMQAAKRAGDKGRLQKIKKTQKAKGCRHSRHS